MKILDLADHQMKVIVDAIMAAVQKLGVDVEFRLERPVDLNHGDYSTNAALIAGAQLGKSTRDIAEQIVGIIKQDESLNGLVESVEAMGPGFINFRLTSKYYLDEIKRISADPRYGAGESLKSKRVVVEYTDPNPFKEFHIGHLMSNTIGESIARLFIWSGATVKRVNYQGDVGMHVAKSVWGMIELMKSEGVTLETLMEMSLDERQAFLGRAYAYGSSQFEDTEIAEKMKALNKKIYDKNDPEINRLYTAGRSWSLEYFETIYEKLGTKFDDYYFESESGVVGLEVVKEGLKKGVFAESKGAVVYEGEKKGLHTRVFRNGLGIPTYEAKDLGLAKIKWDRWEYDLSCIITGNEIDEYFKVVIAAMGELYPELAARTVHKSHGMMKLPSGKMSSRTGNVVTGEGLLELLRESVVDVMEGREIENKKDVSYKVAVAALKYAVLRQSIGNDIVYDREKMISFEGNTGPYLQYTHARAKSVIRKAKVGGGGKTFQVVDFGDRELEVVRYLVRLPEIVEAAVTTYSPHLVAVYLNELAQKFNSFYNSEKILESDREGIRLLICEAVSVVIKNGLEILGIEAPEVM